MRIIKFFVFVILVPFVAAAQNGKLTIEGSSGNLFLDHTTAVKENFYSIGRLYNISPKEIAPYNHLVLEKGLSLGQQIRIPLTGNFTQTPAVAADEAAVPLYHKTVAGETLTEISDHYNKVSFASLREWNRLKTDVLSPGTNLVVGYLKVKKSLSDLAKHGITSPSSPTETSIAASLPKPTAKKEVVVVPVKTAEPPAPPKPAPSPKTEPKPATPDPTPADVVPAADRNFKGGVFRSLYTGGVKEQSGMAGIFKSNSGREDGKYYCLQNNATPGTVLKITNAATGKTIYAKVLDMMPDIKQNAGLVILVSDAAADALGGQNNFMCSINY